MKRFNKVFVEKDVAFLAGGLRVAAADTAFKVEYARHFAVVKEVFNDEDVLLKGLAGDGVAVRKAEDAENLGKKRTLLEMDRGKLAGNMEK